LDFKFFEVLKYSTVADCRTGFQTINGSSELNDVRLLAWWPWGSINSDKLFNRVLSFGIKNNRRKSCSHLIDRSDTLQLQRELLASPSTKRPQGMVNKPIERLPPWPFSAKLFNTVTAPTMGRLSPVHTGDYSSLDGALVSRYSVLAVNHFKNTSLINELFIHQSSSLGLHREFVTFCDSTF